MMEADVYVFYMKTTTMDNYQSIKPYYEKISETPDLQTRNYFKILC